MCIRDSSHAIDQHRGGSNLPLCTGRIDCFGCGLCGRARQAPDGSGEEPFQQRPVARRSNFLRCFHIGDVYKRQDSVAVISDLIPRPGNSTGKLVQEFLTALSDHAR